MSNTGFSTEEVFSVLACVTMAEAANELAKQGGIEDSAEERQEQEILHSAGHKLASMIDEDYHQLVLAACRVMIQEDLQKRLGQLLGE